MSVRGLSCQSPPMATMMLSLAHEKSSSEDCRNYRQRSLTGTVETLIAGGYNQDDVSAEVWHFSKRLLRKKILYIEKNYIEAS